MSKSVITISIVFKTILKDSRTPEKFGLISVMSFIILFKTFGSLLEEDKNE